MDAVFASDICRFQSLWVVAHFAVGCCGLCNLPVLYFTQKGHSPCKFVTFASSLAQSRSFAQVWHTATAVRINAITSDTTALLVTTGASFGEML